MKYFSHENTEEIEKLLMGRTVTVVDRDNHVIQLDNGIQLILPDTDGGCGCSAGCYDLAVLNDIPNIITKVEFVNDPAGDDYPQGKGRYEIYVFTGESRINLASWEGSDGNGYYGTGYTIIVGDPLYGGRQHVEACLAFWTSDADQQ